MRLIRIARTRGLLGSGCSRPVLVEIGMEMLLHTEELQMPADRCRVDPSAHQIQIEIALAVCYHQTNKSPLSAFPKYKKNKKKENTKRAPLELHFLQLNLISQLLSAAS